MTCPKCAGKLLVVDTVQNKDDNETYRRKVCSSCGEVIFTMEFAVERDEQFRAIYQKYYRKKR